MADVQTACALWLLNREMTPSVIGQAARRMEESGVVDYFQSLDQLASWTPRSLWTSENVPHVQAMADHDSFPDPFMIAAYALAATEKLGVAITTDAIRRGPAELVQSMLTMQNGRPDKSAIMMLGAGELKQIKPFGYRRAEGLDRMEDLYRAWNALLDTPGAVDFEGHFWKLQRADIGRMGRQNRPKIWGMGGGPRLLDISAKFADGIVAANGSFPYPEDFAKAVSAMKEDVERGGRDPEKFDFALFIGATIDEDPDVIERAWSNPLMLWQGATLGRLNPKDWEREGITPAVDWHYALKMLPTEVSEDEALAITSRVSREQMEKSFAYGSPAEVARKLKDYVDAGCTYFIVSDLLDLIRPSDEGLIPLGPTIETYRELKKQIA